MAAQGSSMNRREAIQAQRKKDYAKREKARALEKYLKSHFNRMARWPAPGKTDNWTAAGGAV